MLTRGLVYFFVLTDSKIDIWRRKSSLEIFQRNFIVVEAERKKEKFEKKGERWRSEWSMQKKGEKIMWENIVSKPNIEKEGTSRKPHHKTFFSVDFIAKAQSWSIPFFRDKKEKKLKPPKLLYLTTRTTTKTTKLGRNRQRGVPSNTFQTFYVDPTSTTIDSSKEQ